ncbi:hypothetical protein TNCV_4422271 [Trichonephila clavipes]|nr:hypothetical protein TNCV_4422271 [Trichonephila clavipes]
MYMCFRTHIIADTVGYRSAQQTSHSWVSVDQALSSTTPIVGPGTSRLNHRKIEESCLSDGSRFLIYHVNGCVRGVVFKANSSNSMFSRSYTGLWWRYYASENVLISDSGSLSSGGSDHESFSSGVA